jgi:hypothetical protein
LNAGDQSCFAAALLDGARPVPEGLRTWNGSDPERRFAVYRNNVTASLVEALGASFPVTQALVGDIFFAAMAREFIAVSPPRSRLLAEYGEDLPGFVSGFAPAAQLPWLAVVARIEAWRIRAYHAADARALTAEAFRPLLHDREQLARTCISLHPACFWLRWKHAAFSLWAAHQHDDGEAPDLSAIDVEEPQDVLIARPRLAVHTRCLPVGSVDFLDALAAGRPLGEAVEQAAQAHADFDPTQALALLIREGLAEQLYLPATSSPSTPAKVIA